MKHVKLFEDFNEGQITDSDRDLFKKMVKSFTKKEPHINPDDEASLIAICNRLNLKPEEVHRDFLVPRFMSPEDRKGVEIEDIDESVISRRTELFFAKLIASYEKEYGKKDEQAIKDLCAKLGEDYEKMKC